ncbi:MAG: class I SAM-dependent methyltransferase [Myxococcales bacterium]|nr:MAG: class I SAM-dependent methyltransferase [Myxococcales bacterium]
MRTQYNEVDFKREGEALPYFAMTVDRLRFQSIQELARHRKILVLGSGRVDVLNALQGLSREVEVVVEKKSADLNDSSIALHEASVTKLPFEDHSFDVVCCFDGFASQFDTPVVLREMVRVARPGGYVVAEFNNVLSLNFVTRKLSLAVGRGANLLAETWISPWVVRKIVPAGARLLECRGLGLAEQLPTLSFVPFARRVQERAKKAALASPLRVLADSFIAILQKEQPE